MARRPTHKECSGKLRQALEALENGSYQTIDADRHFTPDRDELGSASAKDHWNKVHQFLGEIQEGKDPHINCFAGIHDPESTANHQDKNNDARLIFKTFKQGGKDMPGLMFFFNVMK